MSLLLPLESGPPPPTVETHVYTTNFRLHSVCVSEFFLLDYRQLVKVYKQVCNDSK